MRKRIILIAGTRPNFVKLAPLYHSLKQSNRYILFICHTGQHYDYNMSDVFWNNLALPEPDFKLEVKGEGTVDTIGKTIIKTNEVFQNNAFDLAIVFGDVNATIAGAIVAAHSGVKLMHIEAGLRSFDRSMPEEINRIVTDHVSDYLMVSEPAGIKNLQREGFNASQYALVGNLMIEAIINTRSEWENSYLQPELEKYFQTKPAIVTFHRPENVDSYESLHRVIQIIKSLSESRNVIFPVHPRTMARLIEFGLLDTIKGNDKILITEPLGYFSFLRLISKAGIVITDSGGVQEETSFLNVPCITFRKNIERFITLEAGTNLLLDVWQHNYQEMIQQHIMNVEQRGPMGHDLWNDKVSANILAFIDNIWKD